jgi:hypothetical protein
MARYRVHFVNTISSSVEVEAETASEARELADSAFAYPTLCAYCAGMGRADSPYVDEGEWSQDDTDEGVTEITEDGA